MTRHIVMFKFKGSAEERVAAAKEFKVALDALPEVIEKLQMMEVGINDNPKEEWDLVLTATAASPEDVAEYSAHPAHVAAVALVKARIESRACVDYNL